MSQSIIIPLILIIVSYIPSYKSITTKSVLLTPSNPSQNGVTTKLMKGATNYAPHEFDLYAIDESSFNMQLSLDKSWSFHPQYSTTLTLEIGSDTPTNSQIPTSLLISFSQNNLKYITSVIEIGNNNDDILIYPPLIHSKQTYGEGNIFEIVSSNNNNNNNNRINKATNNGSYDYFAPYINQPNISYPLTFEIENHPNFDYMIFTYFTPFMAPRNIIYYGMDINSTLDIYLSAGNEGNNFDITYFNIIHSIYGIQINNKNGIQSTNLQTTTKTILFHESEIIKTEENNNRDWFESALVVILISTVIIMCCLFIIFGIMFCKIFPLNSNNNRSKIIQITSPKNPMKNEKPLQRLPKKVEKNNINMSPSFTHSKSKSINTMNTNQTTPTLDDILAVLGTKSVSLNDLYDNKQDMNVIFNEVMRSKSITKSKSITNNENINNKNRKNSGEILYEMDEKNSENELEGSDETDDDLELECMYNNNNNITPGNNNNNKALAIDENVNRISIIQKLNSLKLQLKDMMSGDSEALYEQGNNEGTPYGSTDTQNGANTGDITPYNV